jgi:uncharacterized protein YbjT (DUF2867 family)
MKPTILIAGATGATGSVSTKLLLENGFPVRAFVHKDDERAHKLQALGAEIFVGELLDFRAVRRAFEGIKRAYFVYPMRPGVVQATAHYVQAALEAKAEFIVNMSQRTARPDALSDSALQHWLAERVFDWADTPVTHLRPTIFNEWLLYVRKGIREGHYRVPFGPTGKSATISAEDQGAVIAEILANPASHAGQTYPLLGPVELTPPEIAEIVSQTLGKPVRYERITGAQWVEEFSSTPDIPFLVQHMSAVAEMHALGQTAGTNDVVERITGRKPQSVAEFVKKHRAAFQ